MLDVHARTRMHLSLLLCFLICWGLLLLRCLVELMRAAAEDAAAAAAAGRTAGCVIYYCFLLFCLLLFALFASGLLVVFVLY